MEQSIGQATVATVLVVLGLLPWAIVRRQSFEHKVVAAAGYLGTLTISLWVAAAFFGPPRWPLALGVLIGACIVTAICGKVSRPGGPA